MVLLNLIIRGFCFSKETYVSLSFGDILMLRKDQIYITIPTTLPNEAARPEIIMSGRRSHFMLILLITSEDEDFLNESMTLSE